MTEGEGEVDVEVELALEASATDGLLVASVSVRLPGRMTEEPAMVATVDGKPFATVTVERYELANRPDIDGALFRTVLAMPRSALDGEVHTLRVTVHEPESPSVDIESLTATIEAPVYTAVAVRREPNVTTRRIAVVETSFYAGRASAAIIPPARAAS